MSSFNQFARRVNEYAKGVFEEYTAAEARYRVAESEYNANKKPTHGAWNTDAATMAKYARIEANYQEAKAEYEQLRRTMRDYKVDGLKPIRKELEKALADAFAADPERLDAATLELLKSGIMSADEYGRLMDKAAADNNPTMARLIAKHAKERAEQADADKNPDVARAFRTVAYKGNSADGSVFLNNFDVIVDVFRRCTKNPSMIDRWDTLTGEIVEKF